MYDYICNYMDIIGASGQYTYGNGTVREIE